LAFLNKLQNRFYDIDLPAAFTKEQAEELYTKAIKEALEPYMKLKEISMEKIKAILDDKEGVMAILLKQGAEITKLKNEGGSNRPESIKEQIAKWHEANKADIASIQGGQKRDLPEIKLKAPITMENSASLGGSAYLPNVQVLPGVINLIRKSPTFWERLLKPATKANPLVWINKHNKQGSAAFTSEGSTKSQASFELQTETSSPVKITEYMKISTEMLNDIDYIAGVIQNELAYEVDMSSNTGVLTGSGVAPNPKGVTLVAAAYALPGLSGIVAPNNVDAIIAAVAMLRSLNFLGQLTAYINPIDKAQLDLSKTLTGQYVNLSGVTPDCEIVVDNNIAQGYLLIGDMNKYRIQMYQDFYVQWGFVNDDFIKNLVTVIGERRFHQWVSQNEAAAFVYDQFATIRAAIS
jgi:DNA-directed RNA polymerase subunit H (RpoH/RPB5)